MFVQGKKWRQGGEAWEKRSRVMRRGGCFTLSFFFPIEERKKYQSVAFLFWAESNNYKRLGFGLGITSSLSEEEK